MTATDALRARWDAVMMSKLRHPAAGPGPGRGLPGLGRRRHRIPGPHRRHRGLRPRPRPPGAGRRGPPPGRPAGPHQQPVRARARGGPGRAADRPARRRPGVLRQRRRRGQRGRAEDRAAARLDGRPLRRPDRGGRGRGRLPRPHLRRAVPDRHRVQARALRPAARPRHLRAVRGRGRAAGRRHRAHRRRVPGADAGGGRRGPCRRRATWPRPGTPATRPAPCWCWTRCRAGWAGPGPGSPTRRPGSGPTSSPLAKGLGGGLPIGACIAFGPAGELLAAGQHGSTFGGNPVSCAAALAVLDTIQKDDLLASVRTVGDRLAAGLGNLSSPLVAGVRGSGLWRALVLTRPVAARVEAAARQAGVLVNAVQPDAVRLAPPLILSAAEADEAVAALAVAVSEVDAEVDASVAPADAGGPVDTVGPTATERTLLMPRHFLRDDDLRPAEQLQVLDLADRVKADRFAFTPAGRPAGGRGPVRQAVHPHPGVLQRRHRRARGLPAGDGGGRQPARPGRADRGHHPGAGPAVRRHRVADLRPGPGRGGGVGQPGAGGQRPHRHLPPLPGAGRPADRPRAAGPAVRRHPVVRGRRGQQHGPLAAARWCHRRAARPDRQPGRLRPRPGDRGQGHRDRRHDLAGRCC